ncbi:MAG: hypothetical protein WC861_01310 [Candidatus Micrarchaeia archaeon]|jgi:hypothetical protein
MKRNINQPLRRAKRILADPIAAKSASPEFLAWFKRLDKASTPHEIVGQFAASGQAFARGQGNAPGSRNINNLANWAAAVSVQKINSRAKTPSIYRMLGVASCAYKLALGMPPIDLGTIQGIKAKQEALGKLAVLVSQGAHLPSRFSVTPALFVRPGFHSKF